MAAEKLNPSSLQPLPRYTRCSEAVPRLLLQARDLAVLEDVWQHRLLTTSQIELLRRSDPCTETRFVSRLPLTRRLKLLFHHRYLQRIPRPAARGSLEPVYLLDSRGAKALRRHQAQAGHQREAVARTPSQLPKSMALDHLLAINDVRVSLTAACREKIIGQEQQAELVDWLYNDAIKFSVTVAAAGERSRRVALIPDAFFSLRVAPQLKATSQPESPGPSPARAQRLFYFVEVDLGTEVSRTLLAKCQAYLAYWQSGGFARDFSVPPALGFRVLFVTPGQRRANTILTLISHLTAGRTMFWVTTQEYITPQQILYPAFTDGATGQRQSLAGGKM